MARLPRLSVGGVPHLLVQRSHQRQAVFIDDADRALFHQLLGEAARSEGVALHAYGLFDGEVRLVATPSTSEALGRMMQSLGRRYCGAFNRRHRRTGGLWEGRFRATVIEPGRYLVAAMCYAEQDASDNGDGAVTGVVPVSSRSHHLGQRQDALVTDHPAFWALGNTPFDREAAYRGLLSAGLPMSERRDLEQGVQKGWPVGSAGFIEMLSAQTSRRLSPLKRGRPRKVPLSSSSVSPINKKELPPSD